MVAPPSELIRTTLAKSFDGDCVKEGQKFPGKNAPKFVHKLNKQQIE